MKRFPLTEFRLPRDKVSLTANLSDLDENKEPFWVNDNMSFIVYSPFTDREIVWELKRIHSSSDNTIVKWEFAPSEESIKKYPKTARNRLIIFNI